MSALPGFFKRFNVKDALCRMHLHYNLSRVFNVLETIRGINGIVIDKQRHLDGAGWTIGLEDDAGTTAPTPRLWDCRIGADGTIEMWCGDGDQPWFVPRGGGAGYASTTSTGWVALDNPQTYYIMIDDTLSPTLTTTEPDYAGNEFGCAVVETISDTEWSPRFEGPYHLPAVAGEDDRDLLAWDETAGDYVKAAPLDSVASGSEITLGLGKAVSAVSLSSTEGKLLQVTESVIGPLGDSTNVALKWDHANTKFIKALPIETTNDTSTSTELGEGDAVVVGAKTGSAGNLIQLITRPLGSMSGTGLEAGDFTEITVVTAVQISGTYLQVKTRTAKVYTPGAESGWTNAHTFPSFDA